MRLHGGAETYSVPINTRLWDLGLFTRAAEVLLSPMN